MPSMRQTAPHESAYMHRSLLPLPSLHDALVP